MFEEEVGTRRKVSGSLAEHEQSISRLDKATYARFLVCRAPSARRGQGRPLRTRQLESFRLLHARKMISPF